MNPFDGMPVEALRVIEVYSLVGMMVFTILALWSLDRARQPRAPRPAPAPLTTADFIWRHCSAGHHKVLTNLVDARCVVCGGPMLAGEA